MKKKILYQIRGLEKNILRILIENNEECVNSKFPHITPTQMEIFDYIFKNKDKDIYQKDLEEVLKSRRATVSGVLQTMEKNGLIERVVDEEDTRTKKIILNELAKQHFLDKINQIAEIEEVATKGISDEDLDKFFEVITKMKQNLETKEYF